MAALIIFDSTFGNTERVAVAIQEGLGGAHRARLLRAADAQVSDLQGVDLLVVGSPTHGGWYTEPVKAILSALPERALEGVRCAAFDTGTPDTNQGFFVDRLTRLFGRAAPRIGKALVAKGAELLGAQTFLVLGKEGPVAEGELERAAAWGAGLVVR